LKINGNAIAALAHSCDAGIGYAMGDGAWPPSAAGGSEMLAAVSALLAPLGLELDTREADLARIETAKRLVDGGQYKNMTWPGEGTYYIGLEARRQELIASLAAEPTAANPAAITPRDMTAALTAASIAAKARASIKDELRAVIDAARKEGSTDDAIASAGRAGYGDQAWVASEQMAICAAVDAWLK
jgi:hypothetical protein